MSSSGTADPTCGNCGYIVRGISSLNCPECGADLREVGILGPGMRIAKPGTSGDIARWTVLLLISSCFIWGLLGAFVIPRVDKAYASVSLTETLSQSNSLDAFGIPQEDTAYEGEGLAGTLSPSDFPNSFEVEISAKGRQLRSAMDNPPARQPFEDVTVTLSPRGQSPSKLQVRLPAMSYRWSDRSGEVHSSSHGFDEQAVLAWLTDGGVNTSSNPHLDLDAAASDIVSVVQSGLQGRLGGNLRHLQSTGGRSGISQGPSAWGMVMVLAMCLAVWFAGIIFIRRRFRRRQSAA